MPVGDSERPVGDSERPVGDSGRPVRDSGRPVRDSVRPGVDSVRLIGDTGRQLKKSMSFAQRNRWRCAIGNIDFNNSNIIWAIENIEFNNFNISCALRKCYWRYWIQLFQYLFCLKSHIENIEFNNFNNENLLNSIKNVNLATSTAKLFMEWGFNCYSQNAS